MKTLARLLPLIVFLIILLVIRLSGCHLAPFPTTGTSSQTTPIDGTTSQTTAATTTGATTAATSAPTTTQHESTDTQLPTPLATTSREAVNNTKMSWFYTVPDPLNLEIPATIPANIQSLAEKYDAIWQAPATGRKVVYLTMDEGYEFASNTAQILNTAKMKGVNITFFITGSYLAKNRALVDRMIDEGHLVANHTVNHPNLVDLMETGGESAVLAEVEDLTQDFEATCGVGMARLVRPPEGAYSERVLDCLQQAGYRTVFWSFAYRDWLTDEQPDPVEAKAKILGQLHNGSVLLLHAVSSTNVAILPDLIDEIRARGYEFALISAIR